MEAKEFKYDYKLLNQNQRNHVFNIYIYIIIIIIIIRVYVTDNNYSCIFDILVLHFSVWEFEISA